MSCRMQISMIPVDFRSFHGAYHFMGNVGLSFPIDMCIALSFSLKYWSRFSIEVYGSKTIII